MSTIDVNDPPDPRLYNDDLAPAEERTWGVYSLFAMWMSDVHSVGGYVFAAGLFGLGLVGWQVLLALVIGITLVNLGMNWIGYAGQRTGVPYPVLARVSFGVFGANLPALIRAVIAIFWYSIQTWLASVAVVGLILRAVPSLKPLAQHGFLGLSTLGWIAFLALWALQLMLFRRGMETVRRFIDWAGPAIWVVMLTLAVGIVIAAHGHVSLTLPAKRLSGGSAVHQFFAAISLTVAYFSALLLNFCDFSRFAPNRRAVRWGNFWGLPVNFIAFSVVSVVVTAGSIAVYGKAIFDPVELVQRMDNTVVSVLGAITFAIATIGINVVANFVSPAYDLANVAPKHIDFKLGGLITAIAALLVMPWKVYGSPIAVQYFLGGLAAFLGPLFGIIITDYYLRRRGRVEVDDLYRADEQAAYYYRRGWNPKALAAFVPAAAVAAAVALIPASVVPLFGDLAPFSWFIGAALGSAAYLAITSQVGETGPEPAARPATPTAT
ncbi:NCS1 family nucleobase:cation symporter-1 [Actinoallomurus sp. CA-150999]|uniref:NCS1 family nucleobase:cation symporter-1 n=1 Tax=Actinoallomurus sp. CA-150999 TaxID=3239887 RepID=UPI003D9331B5